MSKVLFIITAIGKGVYRSVIKCRRKDEVLPSIVSTRQKDDARSSGDKAEKKCEEQN
jgi:hypothetical protein